MNKNRIYNLSAKLYEEKKFSKAIVLLSKAHEEYPKDTDIIILLAGCYMEIIHFIEAARLLIYADKIKPNDPIIKYNCGYSLLCAGRVKDAMGYMEKCLGLNPPKEIRKMAQNLIYSKEEFEKNLDNNYDISLDEEFECQEKFYQAQRFLYSKKFAEAISLYKEILKKKPRHHQSIQNIGVAYIIDNKPEQALLYLKEANRISPDDCLALGNLAHAYYLLGDTKKSEIYSKQTMEKVDDPSLRDLIRLITVFIEIRQFQSAKKLIDDYGGNFDNIQIDFLLGVLYAKQKDYFNAKKIFFNIRKSSKIADEYYKKTKQLADGEIEGYEFEAKSVIHPTIDTL